VDVDQREGGVDAIRRKFRSLRADARGATAIEYGLIVALIAVAAIGGMSALGGGSAGMWGKLSTSVSTYMG
jgi:pilus assembly protein Flp/PilA